MPTCGIMLDAACWHLTPFLLNLISFDKNTGVYKFQLTLHSPWLRYTGRTDKTLLMKRGYNFKADIKLANGSSMIFPIEGKVIYDNGKRELISFNKNKYFDIQFSLDTHITSIYLKSLMNIPVVINTIN